MKSKNVYTFLITMLISCTFLGSCKKEQENNPAGSSQNQLAERKGGAGGSTVRNPLYIPNVESPNGLTLTAAPGLANLGGGVLSNVWAYNGGFPGPTIKVNRGSNASITLLNRLPEKTITHWHGLVVSTPNDGQPHDAINPGQSYPYSFPVNQRASLNFYHPHTHMLTGKQVYSGLSGAFIINDAEEAGHNLPSGTYEVPLILRDATLDAAGNLNYKPSAGGMFGKIPLVNGTKDAYLDVNRAVYRFRILNGANSRVFQLALSNNAPMILIGNDGGLLPQSSNQTNIVMGNGERVDVLVDFRNLAAGTNVTLRDLRSGWDLVEFRVTGNQVVNYGGSLAPSSIITPLTNPLRTRTFNFEGMSKINGKVYDMHRIDFTVPFQETEQWVFVSKGSAPHPVHVHGASFQVVSRTGGRGQVFAWEAGWKDTVLLEDNETVTVLVRFDAFRGRYLMHCHKLEHEDMGMMSNFMVQ